MYWWGRSVGGNSQRDSGKHSTPKQKPQFTGITGQPVGHSARSLTRPAQWRASSARLPAPFAQTICLHKDAISRKEGRPGMHFSSSPQGVLLTFFFFFNVSE